MSFLDRIYHWVLWFCGFQEGEHISDLLARQKDRLGAGWWAMVVATFLVLFSFLVWFTIHIATYKVKRP